MRTSLRRVGRTLRRRARRRALYLLGEVDGLVYRLRGGVPDADVDDGLLADRVRSTLGPIEKRLDIPRVHVMAEDHVVLLHGDVPGEAEASAVEQAALRVPGVVAVESYLHLGFIAGDTRPSTGRTGPPAPSPAFVALVAAARGALPADEPAARRLARAVLATFTARLPDDERSQLLAHLPDDARLLALPRRSIGRPVGRVRTEDELADLVAQAAGIENRSVALHVTESVLGTLRELVPEEADDVAAVLPGGLRALWHSAVPG